MLPPYTDQLDSARQDVFHNLAAFANTFTLGGGTAMMLQIGHRLSYDFDCFCADHLPLTLFPKIKRVFGTSITTQIRTSEMLMITTPNNIAVSFVWHPYPPLQPQVKTGTIPLFHMDDLVTNKAITMGRRNAWRDYVDLFYVMKTNLYPLAKIFDLSKKRFGGEFNEKLFMEQLVYFDDLKITQTTFLKESYTVDEIKTFLGNQVKSYLAKIF